MKSIELHIFTNSTISSPSTKMIENTENSFCHSFGTGYKTTIWFDPNPNLEKSQQYLSNLRILFPEINQTISLSDGYVSAVRKSQSNYLFMLEHDWEFLPTIQHSLDEIVNLMDQEKIIHMRFNKRSNIPKKFDRELKEIKHPVFSYCTTNGVSNNPHVINREMYMDKMLQFITIREKSFGIEKELSNKGFRVAIYGAQNYPATISHKDGKNTENL